MIMLDIWYLRRYGFSAWWQHLARMRQMRRDKLAGNWPL
jgi:hypothetical protein